MTPACGLAACLCAALACGTALASADDRGLHGTVGLSLQRDDNLFRLPDGVTPGMAGVTRDAGDDGSHRGDTIVSPSLSLDARMALGRQHLGLTAARRETRLQRYSAYDAQTDDLGASWDWQFGNHFDGRLNAGRSEQASQFEDFIGRRRNLLTVRNEHAAATWRPRPDRRLSLDLQRYRGSNDLPERAAADYTVRIGGIEAAWVTPLGTEWSLRWRGTRGFYPHRVIVGTAPIDNSYRQHDSDVGVVLRPGGRTRADVRLGYAVRRHEQVPQRDFEGASGRAAVEWQASGMLALTLEAVRDLNSLDDFDRLYAVSTLYAAGARAALSAQWQLGLRWSAQRIVFGGDPQNVLTQAFGQLPARRDRIGGARCVLAWLPAPRVQVELSVEQTRRSSSRPGLGFSNRLMGVSTQYAF